MTTRIRNKLLGVFTPLALIFLASNANAEYYIAGPSVDCFDCYREVTVYHHYHHHKHRRHHRCPRAYYSEPVRRSSANISVYYNFPAAPPCSCSIPDSSCCPNWDSSPTYYYNAMYPNRYIYEDDYNWDRRTRDDVGAEMDIDY